MLRVRRLLLASLLAPLAGCDPLLSHPGDDFAVTIVTPTPLTVSQQVVPTELLFHVTGCSDFETSFGTVNAAGSALTIVAAEARGNGLYATTVPATILAEPNYCASASPEPVSLGRTLSIRCRDQRRETSANVALSYAATFASFYAGRGAVDSVLPGRAPGSFFTVGSGWLSYYDGQAGHSEDTVTAVDPSVRPRLVERGDMVYLFAGCPVDACGNIFYVDTPELKVGTSASFVIPFALGRKGEGLGHAETPILVPSQPSAMALLTTGDIAMLSAKTSSVVLTLIGTESSRFQAFEGERSPTELARLGGADVFLTATTDGSKARLRAADGSLVGEYALEGSGPILLLSLAPTGDQWLYARSDGVRLASLGADRKPLPTRLLDTRLTFGDRELGAAWLTKKVGLWSTQGEQAPELHSRGVEAQPVVSIALPSTRPDDTRLRTVRRGLGLDQAFAVVTASGVEMFDEAGHSLAGADPFDSSCGRPQFFGGEVAVLDGQTIAVAGTTRVSLFRPSSR